MFKRATVTKRDDLIEQTERRIAIVEARATTLTAAIVGLAAAGCDTAETELLLQDCRRALPILRRQLWAAVEDGTAK